MARHALLIGVSEFADARLARLNAPANDVTALQGLLQDSSRGGFDSVELSLNEDFLVVRDHLSRFFHNRTPDDLLLLYYSGHGILGRGNRLFLATAGSNLDTPRDRSIAAKEIREFIEDSRAERQIIVLDCCHSGAFAEHAKAAAPPPAVTPETFSGGDAGLYVLTAADALQFAWDGTELRAGDEVAGGFSQFTSWLVEGLEKGEAAPDDEQITMDALYRYLFRRARSEGSTATPQRFVQGGVGDLVISRNPIAGSAKVDPTIMAALGAEEYRLRLGAVAELALKIDEGHTAAARAARTALQRHLQIERDYQVRVAISKALGEVPEPSKPTRPSIVAGVAGTAAAGPQEAIGEPRAEPPGRPKPVPMRGMQPEIRPGSNGKSIGRVLLITGISVVVALVVVLSLFGGGHPARVTGPSPITVPISPSGFTSGPSSAPVPNRTTKELDYRDPKISKQIIDSMR